MMKRIFCATGLGLGLVGGATGCGSHSVTDPGTPSVEGVWVGTVATPNGAARTLTLFLHEEGTAIAGSGEIADALGDPYYNCTATGAQDQSMVVLTLAAMGFEPIYLVGRLTSATNIDATLNGSGWVETPVSLARQ